MFILTPDSVIAPGVWDTASSAAASGWTSSRRRARIWLGSSPRTSSNTSRATGTRSGWATQEPSKPSAASRVLSSRTFRSAASLASGSRRLGMKAAMPPIAEAPRWWQARTSCSVYARIIGAVMVTSARSGSTKSSPRSRKFLMIEKM